MSFRHLVLAVAMLAASPSLCMIVPKSVHAGCSRAELAPDVHARAPCVLVQALHGPVGVKTWTAALLGDNAELVCICCCRAARFLRPGAVRRPVNLRFPLDVAW
jgi:hypothetical protein